MVYSNFKFEVSFEFSLFQVGSGYTPWALEDIFWMRLNEARYYEVFRKFLAERMLTLCYDRGPYNVKTFITEICFFHYYFKLK